MQSSAGVVDDALNELELRASRIAQTAAVSALREALPTLQAELRNPAFAQALGSAAVQEAFAPRNRATLEQMATAAGRGATQNGVLYAGLGFAAGVGAFALFSLLRRSA